ncbi:hypothetical protein HYT53_05850 [Candidatus Woesearchaeota archaeon]|nr:hypothetical protein [Candidatus Woesearchaeota archaeon]
MPPVYVNTQDDYSFELTRNRTFADYSQSFGSGLGGTLADILLEHAKIKPSVHFYDIGCGEGRTITDMFEALFKRAEQKGLDKEIVKRIVYIGIDSHSGEFWKNSEHATFYEGDLIEILRKENLLPIDLGVSHQVFPYINHKLEGVGALANLLNRVSGARGTLLIKPFYKNQAVLVSNDKKKPVTISEAFGDSVDVVHQDSDSLALMPDENGAEARLKLRFLNAEYDFWQFAKNHVIGRPGQKISYYSQPNSQQPL